MFVAIYHFSVKSNHEQQFIEAWAGLTKLIYKFEGSLGSRLHTNQDGTYIAYAQWPDRITWKESGKHLPKEADSFRAQMKASCTSIETLYEMEETKDLLRRSVFNSER